jgi:DNA-binding transcriptional MerR regulator
VTGEPHGKSADAFRSISEASDELGVPPHVLRFWEGKFVQIKPMKRTGGRRFYRPEDMALLAGIRNLLEIDGYTIKGVQKVLRDQGVGWVRRRGVGDVVEDKAAAGPPALQPEAGPLFAAGAPPRSDAAPTLSVQARALLGSALARLQGAKAALDRAVQG